jgi:hypothetical protein
MRICVQRWECYFRAVFTFFPVDVVGVDRSYGRTTVPFSFVYPWTTTNFLPFEVSAISSTFQAATQGRKYTPNVSCALRFTKTGQDAGKNNLDFLHTAFRSAPASRDVDRLGTAA